MACKTLAEWDALLANYEDEEPTQTVGITAQQVQDVETNLKNIIRRELRNDDIADSVPTTVRVERGKEAFPQMEESVHTETNL